MTTTTRDSADLEAQLERHRIELTAYCYRMLGSSSDAEDAVQDTMVRAWKGYDRFEGRSALRSWLYRIATNVCFDMLNGKQRRARPMDFGPAQTADAPLPAPLPEATWLEPMPDGRVVPEQGDPAELAVARDSIRLAFVATLQHLPARQRAVLILREVLRWQATEVAELLDTTVASVNSALQRARATLEASGITDSDAAAPLDEQQRELLARYVDAFERYDLDALVTLLSEDVRQSMPPYALWLIGPEEIRAWMLGPGAACRGSRLFPTVANGMPAYAQYKPSGPGGASSPGRSTCWRSLTVALSGSTSSSTPRRCSRSSASTKRSKTRSQSVLGERHHAPEAGHREQVPEARARVAQLDRLAESTRTQLEPRERVDHHGVRVRKGADVADHRRRVAGLEQSAHTGAEPGDVRPDDGRVDDHAQARARRRWLLVVRHPRSPFVA